MNSIRLPWFIRLPGIMLLLAGPIAYTYMNPYYVWGGKEKEAARRSKNYSQVHYKNESDVKVHTEESRSLFADIQDGNLPRPLYSKILTDEEIENSGAYVIGAKTIKND